VLIDHVWRRGVSRERARLDEWARELAPRDGPRRWFGHEPSRFGQFRSRDRSELAARADQIERLRERAARGPVPIVSAVRDKQYNNAVVLAEMLRDG